MGDRAMASESVIPTRQVAVLVGSLRREAYSRKLARALAGLAPETLHLQEVDIGQLPLYNPDLEEQPPESWTRFRQRIRAADAVLFVTPEYNRSVPGALKNALDVGSRPYGQNCFGGKPAAVISCSPGALGAFGANHHLRQSLVFLDMPVLQQPEAYLGGVKDLFDEHGALVRDGTKRFLVDFLQAFARWIEATRRAGSPD